MIVARSAQLPNFDVEVYLQGAAPVLPAIQTFISSAVNSGHPAIVRVGHSKSYVAVISGKICRYVSDEKGLVMHWYTVKKGSGICLLQGSQLQLNWSALQEGTALELKSGQSKALLVRNLRVSKAECDLGEFDHFIWDHHVLPAP